MSKSLLAKTLVHINIGPADTGQVDLQASLVLKGLSPDNRHLPLLRRHTFGQRAFGACLYLSST